MSELYHHGIQGMSWGKRNGPPYPLSPSLHNSVVRRKKHITSGSGIKRREGVGGEPLSLETPAGGAGGSALSEKEKEFLRIFEEDMEEDPRFNFVPRDYSDFLVRASEIGLPVESMNSSTLRNLHKTLLSRHKDTDKREARASSEAKKRIQSMKHSDELYHHGILGMKWGVRRYQPYGEGGYNPKRKGKNRISKEAKDNHPDYDRAHDRKSVRQMSDRELRERNNRLQQERQYASLNRKQSIGMQAVKKYIAIGGLTIGAVATTKKLYGLGDDALNALANFAVKDLMFKRI